MSPLFTDYEMCSFSVEESNDDVPMRVENGYPEVVDHTGHSKSGKIHFQL